MRKDFGIAVSGSRTSEWIDQLYLFYHSTGKSSPFQLTTYFTIAYVSCYGIWIFPNCGWSSECLFMIFYALMSILCLFYDISTFQSFFINFYDFMPSGSPVVFDWLTKSSHQTYDRASYLNIFTYFVCCFLNLTQLKWVWNKKYVHVIL